METMLRSGSTELDQSAAERERPRLILRLKLKPPSVRVESSSPVPPVEDVEEKKRPTKKLKTCNSSDNSSNNKKVGASASSTSPTMPIDMLRPILRSNGCEVKFLFEKNLLSSDNLNQDRLEISKQDIQRVLTKKERIDLEKSDKEIQTLVVDPQAMFKPITFRKLPGVDKYGLINTWNILAKENNITEADSHKIQVWSFRRLHDQPRGPPPLCFAINALPRSGRQQVVC